MRCVACGAEVYLMRIAGEPTRVGTRRLHTDQSCAAKTTRPLVRLSFSNQIAELATAHPRRVARREFKLGGPSVKLALQAVKTDV